jgi:AraC-like DNA-binding protein/Flp pilus assembly protein TadD
MDAARDILARDPASPPRPGELAAAAGVSWRSLQRHFRQVLGFSPRDALLRLRLTAARETLLAGGVPSVLEAALRHGFEHPGRFAIAYRRAFGESPSVTLRGAAGHAAGGPAGDGTRLVLQPLRAVDAMEEGLARRATDDLAIAVCGARGLLLVENGGAAAGGRWQAVELRGRFEASVATLTLSRPGRGVVLATWREDLRGRRGWAEAAVRRILGAIAAERLDGARSMPRHRADVETLVCRARPAALTQEPALVAMALDLLEEALLRDPAHPRALALAAWCRAVGANHCFTQDAEGARGRALLQVRRALALAPDDPDVLTVGAGVLSLTRRLDEAEGLATRSLALDPHQPEAMRRLGFIRNFRGDGRGAAIAFRRALQAWPDGHDGNIALVGLGIANFIEGDYARSARVLARALERQPTRGWPYRFLTAAALHAGTPTEARRALASLRRCFPDLTVTWCEQSDVLQPDAKARVLEGLARAGLPL